MPIIDHGADAVGLPDTAGGTPGGGIEVTPAMIWVALEEWAGFDDARDELDRFLARVYRAMEAVRRETDTGRIPAVAYADLRHLPSE